MSETTPPPSIEEVRDKLCEEYLDYECYAMDGTGPHRDTFKAGWDSALRHLAEAAGGEFDEKLIKGIAEHALASFDGDVSTWLVEAYVRGARYQHAQLAGEIARLKAELKNARAIKNTIHNKARAHDDGAMAYHVLSEERDRLREENERLRQALERITKLFHAAHDNNGSAMDAVGEMAAVARKALAGRGAEET